MGDGLYFVDPRCRPELPCTAARGRCRKIRVMLMLGKAGPHGKFESFMVNPPTSRNVTGNTRFGGANDCSQIVTFSTTFLFVLFKSHDVRIQSYTTI